MKKILLSTTALAVASGFAFAEAKAAEVKVGGYTTAEFVYSDTDLNMGTAGVNDDTTGDDGGFEIYQDSEIIFNVSQKLDNGITIAFQTQLEAADNSGDQIDEAFMTISGNFGQVIIGSENLPNYKMHRWVPNAGQMDIESSDYGTFATVGGFGVGVDEAFQTTAVRANCNDCQNVSYYSPRIAGFQVGVGYAPDSNQAADSTTAGPGAGVYENGINGALDWGGDFGGVSLGVGVNSHVWQSNPTNTSQTTSDNLGAEPGTSGHWATAASVGFAGFSFGAAYARSWGVADAIGTESGDAETFATSLMYGQGPWAVSVGYLDSRARGNITSGGGINDTYSLIEVAGGYALGPGIRLTGSVAFQEENGEVADQLTASDDGETVFVTSSLVFNF